VDNVCADRRRLGRTLAAIFHLSTIYIYSNSDFPRRVHSAVSLLRIAKKQQRLGRGEGERARKTVRAPRKRKIAGGGFLITKVR